MWEWRPQMRPVRHSECHPGHFRRFRSLTGGTRHRLPCSPGAWTASSGKVGGNGMDREPDRRRPRRRGRRRKRLTSKLECALEGGSRPISRVLSRATIHLGRASPRASSDLPGSLREQRVRARWPACFPIWSCSRWGLPCRRMLPPTRCALTAPFHPCLPAARRGGAQPT